MDHYPFCFETSELNKLLAVSNTAALYGNSFSFQVDNRESSTTGETSQSSGQEVSVDRRTLSSSQRRRPLKITASVAKGRDNGSPRGRSYSPMNPLDCNGETETSSTLSGVPSNSTTSITAEMQRLHENTGSHSLQFNECSEVLSRRPVRDCAVETTVTYLRTTGGLGNEEGPYRLSKSAKKRQKKKSKKASQPSCLGAMCLQTATRPSISASESDTGYHESNSQQQQQQSANMPARHLSELLKERIPPSSIRFQEQGIQNLGNTCFLGSAMQFLLSSAQFCWLMNELKLARRFLTKTDSPVLYSMASLASVLHVQQSTSTSRRGENIAVNARALSISPDMLSPIVAMFQSKVDEDRNVVGQDVQEFLLFVLDQMDEELVKLRPGHDSQDPVDGAMSEGGDGGWMVMGRKKKVTVRRTTGSMERSILSSIFGGCVQSEVKASGMPPSVTTHAFTTLILDILPSRVFTVEDAFDLYTAQDYIPEYQIRNSQRRVTATKCNQLGALPPYLIVCLKQYTYTATGLSKVHKHIAFGCTLELKRAWLSSSVRPCTYQLIATSNHHGQGRGGDHYTANVLQSDGGWIHFNDSSLRRIQVSNVLSETPYLLMYKRI